MCDGNGISEGGTSPHRHLGRHLDRGGFPSGAFRSRGTGPLVWSRVGQLQAWMEAVVGRCSRLFGASPLNSSIGRADMSKRSYRNSIAARSVIAQSGHCDDQTSPRQTATNETGAETRGIVELSCAKKNRNSIAVSLTLSSSFPWTLIEKLLATWGPRTVHLGI